MFFHYSFIIQSKIPYTENFTLYFAIYFYNQYECLLKCNENDEAERTFSDKHISLFRCCLHYRIPITTNKTQ